MAAYYNEIDKPTAQWLKELIRAGVIEDGEVCEKDMWDVVPSELVRFNQVHLCAGIGGWSHAMQLAGWPDDRPVWTVSLPCQPFSAAGKGKGLADERGQLADAFFWLAGVCRPQCIFGEQVEAAIKHDWLDVMASQLESIGYTVGAVGFPASSVGAFHIRQRLYWVAYSKGHGRGQTRESIKLQRRPACGVADAERDGRRSNQQWRQAQGREVDGRCGPTGILGDAGEQGLQERFRPGGMDKGRSGTAIEPGGKVNFWSDAEWIPCRDGKARPVESGTFPLVDGLSERMVHRSNQGAPNAQIDPQNTAEARVMRLRGYGNAIVVTQAAAFIESFLSR